MQAAIQKGDLYDSEGILQKLQTKKVPSTRTILFAFTFICIIIGTSNSNIRKEPAVFTDVSLRFSALPEPFDHNEITRVIADWVKPT